MKKVKLKKIDTHLTTSTESVAVIHLPSAGILSLDRAVRTGCEIQPTVAHAQYYSKIMQGL